jgi:hypothetical protein
LQARFPISPWCKSSFLTERWLKTVGGFAVIDFGRLLNTHHTNPRHRISDKSIAQDQRPMLPQERTT